MKCLIILAATLACTYAFMGQGESCKVNTDCSKSQCCVPNHRWMIASKRRVMESFDMEGGTCVEYIAEDGDCHMPGFTSCGCIPGTKCKYYPDPNFNMDKFGQIGVGKRGMIFKPGTSKCETPETE